MKNIKLYLEKIINGEKEGFTASAVCFLLIILSSIYSLLAKFRYRLYKNNILKQKEAEVPVISIGNITTGGTGKTPFTAFLLDSVKDKYRTAVISRGYGAAENVEEPFLIKDGSQIFADPSQAGDELFMLARNKDGIIFIRSADRFKGSKLAQKESAELILLDDGFQHYQLKRDLDVVILDAEDPFSNGRVLPAGYLREPCTALKRAEIFLINRSENIDFNKIQEIRKSLNTLSPDNRGVFAAETVLEKCISIADQAEKDAAFLNDKKVFAFSGIGSPEAFKNSIKNAGGEVVSYRVFEDHYNYKKEDILTLLDQYESSDANLILTTEKDAVKLFDFAEIIGELPFYYLTISMKIDDNEKLMKVIKEKIRTRI
ncbi:MAG: tetraacyldisaccharide 4'-kinase [Halanaerobium sp.]